MRIGLGCMRLSTEPERDEARALATVRAALDAGVVVLDTAHAYGRGEGDLGHNERLVGRVLRERGRSGAACARVVTKCGMRRDGGAWVPDGRSSRIAADVEGSLEALDGIAVDTLLLHAPDPRTSLVTSARALARAVEKGQVARVGVSNVSRRQLEEVAQHAPVAVVEVALGAYDDLALRSGVVSYCLERGIEVFAHAPLGGPERAPKLARDRALGAVSAQHEGASALEIFLAYLLAVHGRLVPIVGARRPATIASWVAATQLTLAEKDLLALDARFPLLGALRRPRPRPAPSSREVVLMMGVPGAGKSRAAEALVARGYERLNRDTLGGTLRGIVQRLDERLHEGAVRLVLDNTYVTRATRNDVVRIAHDHGAAVRCVFFDTPTHEARINVVLRMLGRFGSVLEPAELAARSREDPIALAPHALARMTRDLEPPAADEGFAAIDVVPFVREHDGEHGRPAVVVSLDAGDDDVASALAHAEPDARVLLVGWRPGLVDPVRERARADALAHATGRAVDLAFCTHPGGPPVCWCRPPLPGLWLAFAHRHGVDARASVLAGRSAAERSLAAAFGMRFVLLP